MRETFDPPSDAKTVDMTPILAMFANINEIMLAGLAACAGYRQQVEAQGFSPTAAEAMAEEFHTQMIRWLFKQMLGGKS